jgi:hypothetical protein
MARLTIIVISVLYCAALFVSPGSAVIDPGDIAGLWHFDDGNGDILQDASGNQNDGQINGKAEWVEGKFGKALQFDGKDDWVEVSCSNIGTGDQLTVSVWTKPDAQTLGSYQDHKDLVRSHKIGGGTWAICTATGFNNSNLLQIHVAWIEGGDLWWLPPTGMAVKDEWNHLAVVWDRKVGTATLYRNGDFVAETQPPQGAKKTTTAFSIGWDWAGPFKGVIDELGIYNAALSADDIQALTKGAAIELSGKLTTTWGDLKQQ